MWSDLDKFILPLYSSSFIIFQGFFFNNKLMKHVNLIFPVTIYTEQSSFFINLEGRIRITTFVITPIKNIFSD